jgi:hypothetical protein
MPNLSRSALGSRLYYVELHESEGSVDAEGQPAEVQVLRLTFNVLAPDAEQALRAARKHAARAGFDPNAPALTFSEPRLLPGELIAA